MNDDYYNRQSQTAIVDGRPVTHWKQPIDEAAEQALAQILNARLQDHLVTPDRGDRFAALDFFFVTNEGAITAVGELKRRSHPRQRYPTVPLNFRKTRAFKHWLSKGVGGIYFVMWADEIGYIDTYTAFQADIGYIGTKKRLKSASDMRDPCYLIPEPWFHTLCSSPQLHLSSETAQNIKPQ